MFDPQTEEFQLGSTCPDVCISYTVEDGMLQCKEDIGL